MKETSNLYPYQYELRDIGETRERDDWRVEMKTWDCFVDGCRDRIWVLGPSSKEEKGQNKHVFLCSRVFLSFNCVAGMISTSRCELEKKTTPATQKATSFAALVNFRVFV